VCRPGKKPRKKPRKTQTTTADRVALGAALRILALVARDADHVLVTWDETLGADWLPTFLAAEALLVPLFAHVLKLLHS